MNDNNYGEITKIKSDQFFNLIEEMSGEMEVEILKAQGINNVLSLVRSKDLFSIFNIDCEELNDLKTRACLKLKDGNYMVRPAIKENLDYCINQLKIKLNEQQLHQLNSQIPSSQTHNDSFANTFITSITNNMNRSKYRYQYDKASRRFAASVYALGGRNVYQFLRLNLPGAFPSIPTLELYNNEYCTRIEEGEFRFHELSVYAAKINCSYLYASEDCTGVISKVQYDVETDSFVGFCPALNNGIPTLRQYQTDDFIQLEEWLETLKQSTLVNIHTVQPITTKMSPPFILSSFGTDSKIDAISILYRWLFIYESCKHKNIRIVGFATDADPKYLKAMRLATGYFAHLSNIDLLSRDDILEVTIPPEWSWFFLRRRQLFLCFQDSIHIATKLRNRLLSKTASLMIGDYNISIKDLQNIIDNYSKLDHNLVLSDIYVKDRQNYASCLKISSSNVLDILSRNKNTLGTFCYLTMLRFVILAYIEKSTNPLKRIFYAWSVVFICRFWFMWIRYTLMSGSEKKLSQSQTPSYKRIEHHFITFPGFHSIELNAHVLTFIQLLVINNTLPMESLDISLFSSQPCENVFRSARALTGPFSNMTNFTVQQFLSKTRKISILNDIKSYEESNLDSNALKFPTHHKQNQDNTSRSNFADRHELTLDNIQKNIYDAYNYARSFADKLGMSSSLKAKHAFQLKDLCSNIHKDLEKMIYIHDHSMFYDDDNCDSDEEANYYEIGSDAQEESESEHSDNENEYTSSTTDEFNGMRIYSSVPEKHKHKFFKIEINGKVKYMHKQTAVWHLTTKSNKLSSDRLIRVQKTNMQ